MTATWQPPIDPAPANPGLRTLGTGAQQAAAGNDPRLGLAGYLDGGNAHSSYGGAILMDGGVATSAYSGTPIDGGGA